MNSPLRTFCIPGLALLFGMFAAASASAESMEERLRTQLRSTTQQLQSLQSEQAQTNAARLAAENQLAIARAQIEELTGNLEKSSSQTEQLAAQKQDLQKRANDYAEKSTQLLDQHQQAYQELLTMARATETQRATLEASLNERDEQVRQCAAMNEQMYGVAKEILAAHEAMDMGDVMKIRQPFAGGARVKFEELAQMYGDELYQTIFDAPLQSSLK